MKKIVHLSALLMCAILCTVGFAQTERPKIAVYVADEPGQDHGVSRALTTLLLEAFVNSGRFAAVERSDAFVAEIDREQSRQRSGAIDDEQISRLGRQSGVQYVCVANVTHVLGSYQLSARIINVESADVTAIGVANSPLQTLEDLTSVSRRIVASMLGAGAATPQRDAQAARPAETPRAQPSRAAAPTPMQVQFHAHPSQVERRRGYYFDISMPLFASPEAGTNGEWGALEGGWFFENGAFFGIEFGGGAMGEMVAGDMVFAPGDKSWFGVGANLGMTTRNNRFAYGVSAGFWSGSLDLTESEAYLDHPFDSDSYTFVGFGGPFVRLRVGGGFWITYRGIFGYGESKDYDVNWWGNTTLLGADSGFRYAWHIKIAYRFNINKRASNLSSQSGGL